MIFRSSVLLSIFVVAGVILAAIYSHHGLLDRQKFHSQIELTRERISLIEEENRNLKKQAELLEHPSAELTERQIRLLLGWARSDELVYFEKTRR
ncbi:MAG: septum formation initiator family protein [Deltaproteobacteria bacterium]|nr:septum formation initiator family protein [Deltaproteobacteria bacterium]